MSCPNCNRPPQPYHERQREPGMKYCPCKPKDGDEKDFPTFTDWRGNEVKIGDVIAYPYLTGRSAMLAVGLVERIYLKANYRGWNTRLRVLPLERSYDWSWSETRKPEEERKRSTLQFWDRAILLEARAT